MIESARTIESMSAVMNKTLTFTKASACGNDFLIAPGEGVEDLSSLSRRICDRHHGVGADGVEWTFADSECDIRVRLFNADGSEAEISGNGTRCVAAEISSRTDKKEITVRTAAGVKICRLIEAHGPSYEFESNMGKAEVGRELAIETMWLRVIGIVVSMGNPHFVIFVDQFVHGWQKQAALIQTQSHFPQGTNVEYVIARSRGEIEIRLFERGVGETMSSGTGSCASAVAAIASGRAVSPVKVVAPGGTQVVSWNENVFLRGPATLICRGEFVY